MDDEYFDEGYQAFLDGVFLDDNPYTLDFKNDAWEQGWVEANAEFFAKEY